LIILRVGISLLVILRVGYSRVGYSLRLITRCYSRVDHPCVIPVFLLLSVVLLLPSVVLLPSGVLLVEEQC